MRDILPPESSLWNHVEATARQVFRLYAYQEIRTPLVEHTELFARGVGADTDIVSKEMYTWEDRDQSSLTLRPEATASVMRAYIEHRLDQRPGLKKFFYIGPMFRRERPQKGRYRQFFQIGAEAIGSESPLVDAEIIEMLTVLLGQLGISGYTILLNSVGDGNCRPQYLKALRAAIGEVRDQLCGDCRRRSETNPLRVLDCKIPEDQAIIATLPTIAGSLCEPCSSHFDQLQRYLRERDIAFSLQPRLVRGLDYYTRTAFEFVHGALGAQNSLLGGGRYDGLSEDLGGLAAPGIGFSIGEDRLVMTLEQSGRHPAPRTPFVYVAWMGDAARRRATEIAQTVRAHHGIIEVAPEPAKLKKSLKTASKLGIENVLIVGDDELASQRYPLKNLPSGEQRIVSLAELLELYKNSTPEAATERENF